VFSCIQIRTYVLSEGLCSIQPPAASVAQREENTLILYFAEEPFWLKLENYCRTALDTRWCHVGGRGVWALWAHAHAASLAVHCVRPQPGHNVHNTRHGFNFYNVFH
jgi:hypothetical protein